MIVFAREIFKNILVSEIKTKESIPRHVSQLSARRYIIALRHKSRVIDASARRLFETS